MRKILFCVTLWLNFLLASPCQGDITVQKQVLDNGLTVILKEIHTAPIVALQMWVKVGGADENEEKAGISHLIEHMLFKGTARRKVGEIAREIETAGGEINAWTSHDEMVFYIVIPSRYFSTALDVVADAIQNSSFDPQELEREKEVVVEEIKMRTDQPSVRLDEALFAASYTVHPYRRPISGFEKTVQNIDREKIMNYFREWFTPENMNLVVTGDVTSHEALTAIEDAFKDFSSHGKALPQRPSEPPQSEFRSIVLREDVQKAYMEMAFHIPGITHDDIYALDMLASILGAGDSSRFFQRLKSEEKLVYSIYAYAYTPKEPGLFIIGGNLEADNVKAALGSILQEIDRLNSEPASPEEIQRAKINLESDFVYGKETVQGEARQLGYFETVVGDVAFEQTYLSRINQVTAHDISQVARKYLAPPNLTVGLLLPEGAPAELTPDRLKEVATKVEKPAVSTSNTSVPVPEKWMLPNGITLIVSENHRLPIVAIQAVFLGGVRFEGKDNNGINHFIAEMLTQGTKNRSALQIAKEIESMAGSMGGFSGRNSFGVSGTVLSQFFESGLELLGDVILNPSFPEEEVEKKRADILAAIERKEDQPFAFTVKSFDALFFEKHPYGMDPLGTKETINKFTSADLRKYYSHFARPKNLVLAIVGDVDSKILKEKVSTLFQGFSNPVSSYPVVLSESYPATIRRKEILRGKKTQAHIMLGFPGIDIKNPDKYSLQVLTTILAGQGGRLFTELRDKQSLAYALSPFEWEGTDPGYIAFYVGCSPSKVDQAVNGIASEVKKITEEKVMPQELVRAQNFILGNFSIEHQSNGSVASDMAFNERYGLGYDYAKTYLDNIMRVTVEDVQSVAKKYLDLNSYTLVIVKPEQPFQIE